MYDPLTTLFYIEQDQERMLLLEEEIYEELSRYEYATNDEGFDHWISTNACLCYLYNKERYLQNENL